MNQVAFTDLSLIQYDDAWVFQEKLFAELIDLKIRNRSLEAQQKLNVTHHLLICEHYPVITIGRSGNKNHILVSEEILEEKNIQIIYNNRGGDVTFHGPGQLVGYPILDLDFFYTDIGKYLRNIEEVIIKTLAAYGLVGERLKNATGVWIEAESKNARKICAIGIKCSRWVTMHGFAFNVNTNLDYFKTILACGIHDKGVTSLQNELSKSIEIEQVKETVKYYFEEVFNCTLV